MICVITSLADLFAAIGGSMFTERVPLYCLCYLRMKGSARNREHGFEQVFAQPEYRLYRVIHRTYALRRNRVTLTCSCPSWDRNTIV